MTKEGKSGMMAAEARNRSDMATERRGHPRYEIMAQVRLESDTVNHILEVRNISISGLLVSTTGVEELASLSIGQKVELDIFNLTELDNIRVSGRVAREHRDEHGTGYGVELTDMDPSTKEAMERLVDLAYRQSIHPPPLPT
jgi:hypothetical protein